MDGREAFGRKLLSRRSFLELSGAGLAGATLLGTTGLGVGNVARATNDTDEWSRFAVLEQVFNHIGSPANPYKDITATATFVRSSDGSKRTIPLFECAGQPCIVERFDGSIEHGAFPEGISPHQPFQGMWTISYEVVPGVRTKVRFEGEVFEMEDQRNWTDASYKTYGTPLDLPFPVEIKEGTTISQSVTLSLGKRAREVRAKSANAGLTFTVDQAPSTSLPRVGLCAASHGKPLTGRELLRLETLNLSHLRVDLNLAEPAYEADLRRANVEASALDLPLEVALFLSDNAVNELGALANMLEKIGPAIRTWLIFREGESVTGRRWVELAREFLVGYDSTAKVGAGTSAYFTDLNRNRPPVRALDLLAYSINPQVHAFDEGSLVETLEMQAVTVENARRLAGELPLAVSPVTLKPRFLPTATGPEPEPALGDLPRQVDVRQMSLFGAGWTLGSLKYLSESGVDSVTYYETSGWRGVMETEAGSPITQRFRSLPGAVFPLYHVLDDVGAFAGGEVVPTTSSHPLKAEGLAMSKDGRKRVLLANLTAEPQRFSVQNLEKRVRVRHLDESNALEAMHSPENFRDQQGERLHVSAGRLDLTLLPYGIARIDTVKEAMK